VLIVVSRPARPVSSQELGAGTKRRCSARSWCPAAEGFRARALRDRV